MAIATGLLLGYWLSKALALKLSMKSNAPRFVTSCSALGTLLIIFPALYVSFIVGGNLGGGLGEFVSKNMGFDFLGVPIGLFIGITIVFGSGIAIGSLVGGLIGRLISYTIPKSTSSKQSHLQHQTPSASS